MRYTEVRMDRLAHELLADIDKETVDFGPNYDDSLTEPLVLPCKFPNLLVNGSEGIAVGMATKIPPHNLGEVIDGLVAVIDNPAIDFEELIQLIPGPDFPTAGFILVITSYSIHYTKLYDQGKTNILEAIYLLANLKSFRSTNNEDFITYNYDFCSVKA